MDLITNSTPATAFSASSIWAVTGAGSELVAVAEGHEQVDYLFAITLALNLLCTGKDELPTEQLQPRSSFASPVMVSWKIWTIYRSKPAAAGVRFMGIMAAIIESGQLS